MDECGTDPSHLVENIGCIVTYGGSTLDMAINYTLLTLNVSTLVYWWLWVAVPQQQQTLSSSHYQHEVAIPMASLVFTMAFQIGLCLILACSGISIVWCACVGWYLHKSRMVSRDSTQHDPHPPATATTTTTTTPLVRGPNNRNHPSTSTTTTTTIRTLEWGLGVLNAVGVLYYAWTAEPITTVAHGCAVLLGMVLSFSESILLVL